MPPKKDFKDRLLKLNVEINGKKYKLKRFTIAQELALKEEFEDLEKWHNDLGKMDATTLVKTLWIFLEPTDDFEKWQDLAEVLGGDIQEKMNIVETITVCMTSTIPEVQEAIKKKAAEAKQIVLDQVNKTLSTGPGSSTNSSGTMDGK